MQPRYDSIVRVGVDLAKSVVQLHAVAQDGRIVVAKQIPRREFLTWCHQLPADCVVAMEACSAAHLVARQLDSAGLAARLIAPALVPAYRMSGTAGKNDANDAQAVCEAASRPQMRFVPPKTLQQQSWLAIHRLREGYIKDRIACMHRARAILFEFGIDVPRAVSCFPESMATALSEPDVDLPPMVMEAMFRSYLHYQQVQGEIAWCDQEIDRHIQTDINAQRAMSVRGVGRLSASALAATAGDLSQFKSGKQFGAWLGLVPSQRSTGGKQRLGRITKRGDPYLRTLLVQGAGSVMASRPKGGPDRVYVWAMQLRDRIGWRKATVAIANRNARILWGRLARCRPQEEH